MPGLRTPHRCKPCRIRHKCPRGFTLLELLVAMVIMAMVMTAAFGAVRIGSRSWEAGHERADVTDEMRSVAEFLRRQLGQTVPIAWHHDNDTQIAFVGRQRQIRFVAPAPFASRGAGLMVYALVIDTGMDALRMELSYAPYDPGVPDFTRAPGEMRTAFETNVDAAALDYFGATKIDGRFSWRKNWPVDAELFPQLVRLRTGASNGGSSWPELVFPVQSRRIP